MNNQNLSFSRIISVSQRAVIYSISLISTLFLTFYAQLVCPFLESLPFIEQLRNLLLVFIFQIILREILFHKVNADIEISAISGRFFRLLIISWIASGVAAMGLHEILYHNYKPDSLFQTLPWPSDVPWHSQLKIMSGYWFLGAGLLSQLELTIAERFIRAYVKKNNIVFSSFSEHIPGRITWGNFFYTFVPSISLLIIIIRYAFQDHIIPWGVTLEVAYIGIIFVGAALAAAVLYGKMLQEDTLQITKAIEKIGKGDFSLQIWPSRQDELGQIAEGINEMAQGLVLRERIKESFGHFVSPEIAKKFIEQYIKGKDMRGHGERKKVAVLMCDIRNFSGITNKMNPSDVALMLNNYFDHMVAAIRKHGGIVDKFIGDAVMAVFGLMEDKQNPSIQAVNAAIEMRSALRKSNEKSRLMQCPSLDNGIGIHYGEVIASYLGSSERLEFTVIGATVNTAARLESKARKPNPPIIISKPVALAVQKEFGIAELGEEELKGVGKQKLYTVKTRKVRK
ncbi:MAG: adenylate/guanylate cyclase domain-containing protein [Spirochaetia bacterium]|jgi:adenylate cyclase|nr:adenylate/guanylate cyclase domain-containing protein [Spirochaetia bacterium]